MVKVSFISSTLLLLLFCTSFVSSIHAVSSMLQCPVNFTYLENYRTELLPCQEDPYSAHCCLYLLQLLSIGFSQYLRESSMFFLPNASYMPICVSSLKQKLNASSSADAASAVSLCFKEMSVFVASNSGCYGIVSLQDWKKKVGPTPSLDISCKGDLSFPACSDCFDEVNKVVDPLRSGSSKIGDINSCYILTVMYAAGIANEYGPLDRRTSSCMMQSERDDELDQQPSKGLSKASVLQLVFGLIGGVLVIGVLVLLYRKKLHSRRLGKNPDPAGSSNPSSMMLAKMGLRWFRLQELERATGGFSNKNLVGAGTFGVVYRGKLEEDGSLVAVKELLEVESFGNEKEFVNEVEIMSKIKHRNLLSLRGCCVDLEGKRRFLVYDFMANGSVADHLSNVNRRIQLCWELRKNIIIDVAKGIVYLHCGVKPAIYHRDIKASNILLDSDMRAKVADFGLARQGKEDGFSHITTRVAGTRGFLAPEYAMYGHLTHKSDVYSFGVLILEIVTAKRVIDTSSSNSSAVLITDLAWNLVKAGRVKDIFDETMKDDEKYHGETMTRFVMVGILCAHVVAARRPTITEALRMLEGEVEVPEIPDRPLALSCERLALDVIDHVLED